MNKKLLLGLLCLPIIGLSNVDFAKQTDEILAVKYGKPIKEKADASAQTDSGAQNEDKKTNDASTQTDSDEQTEDKKTNDADTDSDAKVFALKKGNKYPLIVSNGKVTIDGKVASITSLPTIGITYQDANGKTITKKEAQALLKPQTSEQTEQVAPRQTNNSGGAGTGTGTRQTKNSGGAGTGTGTRQTKNSGGAGTGTGTTKTKNSGGAGTGTGTTQTNNSRGAGTGTGTTKTNNSGGAGTGTGTRQTKNSGGAGTGTGTTKTNNSSGRN